MKLFYCFIPALIFIIFSCDKHSQNPSSEALDCEKLKTGIVSMDSDIVRTEIDKLLSEMEPVPTDSDGIGHADNLNTVIQILNDQCVETELLCYACIKILPLVSELRISTESGDSTIKRILDIFTPSDGPMFFAGIHSCSSE